MSSADLVVAVDPLTGLLGPFEAALVLPFEVTEAVLRTGVVLVVPTIDRVRVVEAVGEVTFLPFATVPEVAAVVLVRLVVDGTVDFLTGAVEVEEVTEVLLATLGVAVGRVGGPVVVAVLMPGVLEARTVEVVGLVVPVAVEVGLVPIEPVRVAVVGFVVVDVAVEDLVMGVFEVVEVALLTGEEEGFAVPASPAAAKEDIRLFTLGVLSDIYLINK